jgi:hypothetical protein
MASAAQSMLDTGGFGCLGCREEVAPFYTTCGERGGTRPSGLSEASELAAWLVGTIDLRGRAW